MHPDFTKRLIGIVGPDHVSVGRPQRAVYSYDASLIEGAPEAVVFPGDVREAAAVVRAALEAGVPFVPRGFGTNLSGGSVPLHGGLIIGLARFNRILSIELENRRARVQPGVPNLELQNALAPFGFFYAPDPASQKVATLGGNAAENSGGPRCLKYGVTTNHILGLEMILSGGEVVSLGGPNGDASGMDLRGLMIGSEGTFGIITELTVRILPKAESVVTMLVIYDDVGAAARSVAEIIAAGIVPAALEMMDQPIMQAVEQSFPCGYPLDAAAVLIVEVEGPAEGLTPQVSRIRGICQDQGCREIREAKTVDERDRLWSGRRGAFGAVSRLAPRYLVCDCTVPRYSLPEALEQVAAVVKKHGLACGNVFHAGDGNLHPLIYFDPRLPGQEDLVHRAGFEVMEACVKLGGTITGEHGVGMEKREAMRLVFSEDDLTLMKDLKTVLDPENRLNPSKMIPENLSPPEVPEPPEFSPDAQGELIPADEAEAAQMVRWAYKKGQGVLPLGSGFCPDYGNASEAGVVGIHTTRLNQVFEHEPANQVVSAGAGITLAELQKVLAEGDQWLPLRPPMSDRRTLGGITALGAFGPDRMAYGAPRDLLLGLRFVSGRGRVISGGGKVVKNVAGYDLSRMMAGSAGSLGLLTRLTFRVIQKPDLCRALAAEGTLKDCAEASARLLTSSLAPTYVYAAPAEDNRNWIITAGFEGRGEIVDIHAQRARTLMEDSLGTVNVRDYEYLPGPWQEEYGHVYGREFVLRFDLPLIQSPNLVSSLADVGGFSALVVDLGNGRVLAGADGLDAPNWNRLAGLAGELGGFAVCEKAPMEFKKSVEVFGPFHPEWTVMHRIKKAVDPRGIFAPGRWPGEHA